MGSRFTRRIVLPVTLALALACPSAASAFSISGTVTAEAAAGGGPLENICVQADGQDVPVTGLAKTGPLGTYSMTSTFIGGGDPLPAGSYIVTFHNCSPFLGGTGDWVTQCFNNCAVVTLTGDSPDATANAVMQQGGYLTGTVSGGGNPLNNICVQTRPADFEFGPGVQTNTAADGTYTLHNLKPGGIKIFFSACQGGNWVTQYYSGKPDFASADTVTVNAGGASTPAAVDVTMQPGATIHGTVTDAAHPGTGIENICVNVDKPLAGQNGIPVTAKGAYTAANGTYSVTGLAPGSYKVEFKDCFSAQGFLTKWFDGKADFASATTIGPLAAGDSASADQALDKGSSIAGTVTGTGGAPLANVCVEAYDPAGTGLAGPTVAATTTNGSGSYKLTPLIGGDYKIRFRDCAFHPSYAEEWFDNKADFASADVVTVNPGADVTGKDAALAAGGHIAGRVTDGTNPIESICLRATQDVSDPYAPVAFAQTAANGSFDLTTLPAGQYVLEITDCNTLGYVGRFWDDKETSEAADRISVTAGSTANLPHDIVLVAANDTTAPDTSLTAAPSGTITTTSARFDYLSNEPLVTFICSITKQGGSPETVACPAGDPFGNHVTVENLSEGTYTFSAAAHDRGNNQDATPVTATFTVATAPDTGGGTVTEPVTTPAPVTTPPTPSAPAAVAVKCVVPKLIGLTLKAAKKALAKRHCRLGHVTKKKAKRIKGKKKPRKGTVIAQRPKRGSHKPGGSKVALVLAK